MSTTTAHAHPPLPTLHPAQRRTLRPRLRLSIRDASLTDLSHPDDASGRAANHFWKLEPSPLVIPAEDWTPLEAGLRQRARLVNALLVDLYQGQRALREKILPPEAVLSDPFYRRPCLGLDPARDNPAALLRFDLVRTPAGWRCVQTRSNTPIGVSYATQNRRFMTQEAGDLYRALPDYHSVINFPLQLLASLAGLAPADRPVPHIVVLTAGPGDAFYSEHSFLARKMGLPLARGDDLIVLDNTVYFKTVAGLERVDVIYRRLNDAHIDPVVFSTDRETAGIPGLLQCIRAGRVAIANSIGCGLAESRVIEAYLPKLCRFYLGEKLLLPAPETYACGDPDRLEQILDQPERFVVQPAHESPDNYTVVASPYKRPLLTRKGLDRVVRENPHAFVARVPPEALNLDGRRPTRARPVFCLSAFALSHAGKRHDIYPGGLVRLGGVLPPVGRVGDSADCLVLQGRHNSGGVADLENPDPGQPPRRPALGSRAAENLFWLGRYLERAESTARMLAILDDVALEEIPARDRKHWLPVWRGLLEATGHEQHRIDARARPQNTLGAELAWRMTLDGENPAAVASAINSALYNAGQLRDYVSPEAWRVLTRLNARLDALRHRQIPASRTEGEKARQLLASEAEGLVLEHVPAFHATADHTMLHDAAWHFLRLGVLLERAIMTCSALRHVLGAHARPEAARPEHYRDNPELSALLRMLGSQDAYRRLYQSRSQPRYVAEFFLRQPDAPHGVFHLVHEMRRSLLAIREEHAPESPAGAPEQAAHDLLAFLIDLKPAGHFVGDAGLPPLGELLATLLERLYGLYPVFNDHHFSHQARLAAPLEDQPELALR